MFPPKLPPSSIRETNFAQPHWTTETTPVGAILFYMFSRWMRACCDSTTITGTAALNQHTNTHAYAYTRTQITVKRLFSRFLFLFFILFCRLPNIWSTQALWPFHIDRAVFCFFFFFPLLWPYLILICLVPRTKCPRTKCYHYNFRDWELNHFWKVFSFYRDLRLTARSVELKTFVHHSAFATTIMAAEYL